MTWADSLPDLHARAWMHLRAGVADAAAPARQVALASVALDGGAELRTVVLRDADAAAATLSIHTDLKTAKVAELVAEPRASLLAWIAEDALQIRLRVTVAVVAGPVVDPLWRRVPEPARVNYGGDPLPGQPLSEASDFQPRSERGRFAVLTATVREMDLVWQGDGPRRRAVFRAQDGFAGQWVAP